MQNIAFSIEIYLKNALKILHFNKHKDIPDLKSYGHDIVKLAQQVINEEDKKARQKQLAKEDLYFWQNDKALQKLLDFLTDYGKGG